MTVKDLIKTLGVVDPKTDVAIGFPGSNGTVVEAMITRVALCELQDGTFVVVLDNTEANNG